MTTSLAIAAALAPYRPGRRRPPGGNAVRRSDASQHPAGAIATGAGRSGQSAVRSSCCRIVAVLLLLGAVPAFAASPGQSGSTVPFRMVTSGGNPRPIIVARINGHSMPMMVHSQATLFAQLKHAQAAAFGVRLVGGHEAYGIDRPGHVSELGRDDGVAARFSVGGVVDHDAPISVFEVPQDEYGMLGTEWIVRHRLILDYPRRSALVSPSRSQAAGVGSRLRHQGYVALPMTFDAREQRFRLKASVNGVERSMTIGSASEFTLDEAFARVAGVRTGPDEGHGSGPTGAHVANYRLAAPVRIRIGTWQSPLVAAGRVMDTYGYDETPRPADPAAMTGGELGGDFLLAAGAVIDFGSHILYVRRPG